MGLVGKRWGWGREMERVRLRCGLRWSVEGGLGLVMRLYDMVIP